MSDLAGKKVTTAISMMTANIHGTESIHTPKALESLRMEIEKTSANTSTPKRGLKLWEIETSYHCSLIGTCLTLNELKNLAHKAGVTFEKDAFDYEIHGIAVQHAAKKGPLSKRMEQRLRRKYRSFECRYAAAKTDRELLCYWEEDVLTGEVAGAYWAIMRHPCLTEKTCRHVYGQVHMLSHLSGYSRQTELASIKPLRRRCASLARDLEQSNRERREMRKAETELRDLLLEKDERLRSLDGRFQAAMIRIAYLEKQSERQRLLEELDLSRRQRRTLADRLEHIETELQKNRETAQFLAAENECLVARLLKREADLRERTEECIAAEEQLAAELSGRMERNCENCLDRDCPGPELCGKRVLYVGGQTRLIRHYKTLIELSGGEFIHHDGGMEDAKKRLASLMAQADVLFCPIDCISHDACMRVKRTCKHMGKQFVPLRSSGVSSLARGLAAIAES